MVWVHFSTIHRSVFRASCQSKALHRRFCLSHSRCKGVVVGVYEEGEERHLSPAGEIINKQCGGLLQQQLKQALKKLKAGKSRVLYGLDQAGYSSVAIANLGSRGQGFDDLEQLDEGREAVRTAVASGVKQLAAGGELDVEVDPCGDAEAAAEGCILSLFSYDELKAKDSRKPCVRSRCFTDHVKGDSSAVNEAWQRGVDLAEGQNFSRYLMEAPANHMTPTLFARHVQDRLGQNGLCEVTVRNKSWAEEKKMAAFLSVSQGSEEPPVFLEIDYRGGNSADDVVALVGKGVTFDTGGISLKPPSNMDQMRADMGGAACVVGAMMAAAQMKVALNVKALIPLCENMPSGKSVKPGDVVTAMNGKTIQVDNTDAEGRLILADALCYAETFKPSLILDLATLTGAICVALGTGASAVYSTSTPLWHLMNKAGSLTGDRVWRMPLFRHYTKQVSESDLADINNIGTQSRDAGSCTAAAFLKEFVTHKQWMHMDIAGVMSNKADVPYLGKGMSGRPTRTLVEFLSQLSKQKLP